MNKYDTTYMDGVRAERKKERWVKIGLVILLFAVFILAGYK